MQKEIFPRKEDKTSKYRRYAKRNIFLKKKTRLGVYYVFKRMNNKIMHKHMNTENMRGEIFPSRRRQGQEYILYIKE